MLAVHSSRLTESLSLFRRGLVVGTIAVFVYGTLPYIHPDLSPRSDPDVGLGLRPRRFFPSSIALSFSSPASPFNPRD